MSGVARPMALLVLGCAVHLAAACGPEELGPPVAIPGLRLDRERVPLGGPLRMVYSFTPTPGIAALSGPYRVSVRFLDADGTFMFDDDHDPPVPTTEWQSGQPVFYERVFFVPLHPYVGTTSVAIGLYAPETGHRAAVAGAGSGGFDTGAASIELAPPPRSWPTLRGGWHGVERAEGREWRWTSVRAAVAFWNPRRDARLYLQIEGRPDLFEPGQRVDLIVGDRTVESLLIDRPGVILHTTELGAGDFGEQDTIELALRVDPTFVPAELPGSDGGDTRRLGIRVYRLFIESP